MSENPAVQEAQAAMDAENGNWVSIIHPETGATGVVARISLPQHYAAGWRLLTDEEQQEPETEPDPPPVSKAQAAKTAGTALAEPGNAEPGNEEK